MLWLEKCWWYDDLPQAAPAGAQAHLPKYYASGLDFAVCIIVKLCHQFINMTSSSSSTRWWSALTFNFDGLGALQCLLQTLQLLQKCKQEKSAGDVDTLNNVNFDIMLGCKLLSIVPYYDLHLWYFVPLSFASYLFCNSIFK